MGDYKRKEKPDERPFAGGRPKGRSRERGREMPGPGNKDFDRFKPKLEMHTVVCDRCSVETEVPFKPTLGKPVFCRDCFNKEDKGRERREGSRRGDSSLEEINRKLDRIMRALKID